jgi:hypothetical protein
MPSSLMCRPVALVTIDVSEERIIRVTRIGGFVMLAVTSNRRALGTSPRALHLARSPQISYEYGRRSDFLAANPEVSGSIPGAIRFSE